MKYRSTRDASRLVSESTAVLEGLPPDGGLYVPAAMPRLDAATWGHVLAASLTEAALPVARAFFAEDVPASRLRAIVEDAFTFDAPCVRVSDRVSVLELFHGPTLAFKDFGARFMARLMPKMFASSGSPDRELTVLVATSGDTGGAVAAGFHGVPGVRVVLLFPQGRVSPVQELQLTTFGENVTALEVEGTFDDCQALVKRAFSDREVRARTALTSANSINVARLVPQALYYVRAWQQLTDVSDPRVFCVPSGNLGNLTAGLWARELGLPADHFIAATNVNDAFVRYLSSTELPTGAALRTLSNAMDVAIPSNLERIDHLFGGDVQAAAGRISGYAFDDDQTLETMRRVHRDHGYVLDPHSAVGWRAAEAYLLANPDRHVVLLSTAHPAKFPETVERALGFEPEAPPSLAALRGRTRRSVSIPADDEVLRRHLLDSDSLR